MQLHNRERVTMGIFCIQRYKLSTTKEPRSDTVNGFEFVFVIIILKRLRYDTDRE